MNEIKSVLRYYPGTKNKIFVILKWLVFPFKQMEKYFPKMGEIVDIGCGEGLFTLFLALKQKKRKVYGIDLNSKKIKLAKQTSINLPNISFKIINAFSWKTKVDGIVISDVFHHFPKEKQEPFLRKTFHLLNNKGVLLIKEINKDDFVRSRLSRIWDYFLYPKDQINYWSKRKLIQTLTKIGFRVTVKRDAYLFPGSTFLYICSKD